MTNERQSRSLNCRVTAVAIAAGLLAGYQLRAEEPQNLTSDAASQQTEAERTREQAADERMAEVKAQLDARSPVSESAAVEMLAAVHALPENLKRKYYSQYLYMEAVWIVALRQSLNSAHGESDLLQFLERDEKLLEEKQLPADVRSIGKLYLAFYYYKSHNLPKRKDTIIAEPLAKSMTSENVWPGFRGLYWKLRGMIAAEEANFADAWYCNSKALASQEASGDEAEIRNNLGQLLLQLGNYASAEGELNKAAEKYIEAKETESPRAIYPALNLAKAREANRDYEESIAQLEKVLTRIKQLPDSEDKWELECNCRNNLAIGQFSMGQFKLCEQLLTECRPKTVEAFGENHVHVAEVDVNLGWTHFATDRLAEAEEKFAAASRRLQTHHPGHHRIPEVMGYLARTQATTQPDAARELLEKALRLHEQSLQSTLSSALSERDRLAYIQQLRVHPESLAWPGVFDTYLQLAPVIGVPVADQYRHVLAWKGALASHAALDATGQASDAVRQLETKYAKIRRRLLVLAQQRNVDPQRNEEMGQLELNANRLEREIRQLHQTDPVVLVALSTKDVAAALPAAAALLDIVEIRGYRGREEGEPIADDRYYVGFLVTRDGDVSRFEFGPAEDIDDEVAEFVKRIKGRDSIQSRKINELFASRLRRQLDGLKLLIISADGELQQLPWCALPGNQHKYWAEELTIAQVASARSLVIRQKPSLEPPAEKWLAVGDVAYGKGKRFAMLPSTGLEAKQVGQKLQQHFSAPTSEKDAARVARVLTGSGATKARVLELLPNCQFAHIATHGDFFRGDADAFAVHDVSRSLDSALAFAGANDDPTGGVDSLLTAEEIGGMNLSKVDLVVLSACETGLGHIRAGQGLVGLPGALDRANVRSAVTALWKVDDTATAKLMGRFYEHLFETPGELRFAEALRQAQNDLLRQSEYAHPYYWAAWSVGGSPSR